MNGKISSIFFIIILFANTVFAETLYHESLNLLNNKIRNIDTKKYSIVFLSDTHVGYSKEEWNVTRRTFQKIKRYDPLFILHGGDVTPNGRRNDFLSFRKLIKKYLPNIPVFAVPGNHDNDPKGTLSNYNFQFKDIVGPVNWSLSFPKLRLKMVGLDDSHYNLSNQQLAMLDAAFRGSLGTLKFSIMHIPPYKIIPDNLEVKFSGDSLIRVLDRRKPRLALFGHLHRYVSKKHGKVQYLVAPSSGGPIHRIKNGSYGFVLIKVDGNKTTFTKIGT